MNCEKLFCDMYINCFSEKLLPSIVKYLYMCELKSELKYCLHLYYLTAVHTQ